MDYKIPIDYSQIYKDRIIIITGVGRSGTTQLGRILGSMQNTCYIFEPAILKLMPLMLVGLKADQKTTDRIRETVRSVFFEDYCLPTLTGRNANLNTQDWTYIHDYISERQLKERWQLSGRQNAIEYVEREKPYWIIKSPEALSLMLALDSIFGGVQYVHIIRDGLGVIESAIAQNWYTNEYMQNRNIDWIGIMSIESEYPTFGEVTMKQLDGPWYATKAELIEFIEYNPLTRAAYIWRRMVQNGMAYGILNPEKYLEIRYENTCSNPFESAKLLADRFNLKWTAIMEHHTSSTHKSKPINETLIDQIQEPERSRFTTFREIIGY